MKDAGVGLLSFGLVGGDPVPERKIYNSSTSFNINGSY